VAAKASAFLTVVERALGAEPGSFAEFAKVFKTGGFTPSSDMDAKRAERVASMRGVNEQATKKAKSFFDHEKSRIKARKRPNKREKDKTRY
jgi:hypothetical protein